MCKNKLESEILMSNYNWCHGPQCHEKKTQSRIRGSKGNKVLRTIRVKVYQGKSMFGNSGGNIWDYFCNHQCLMDFMAKHAQAVANIAPRSKALETPIEVEVIKHPQETTEYGWTRKAWTEKRITEVDNA
jgi:hypothetical protein